MRVEISLLGGFSVVVDGRPVAEHAWTRRNAAALVKLLALRPGRRHPGDLPEHHRVVAGIRAALGDDLYERLHAEGARMSLDQALVLVLEDEDQRQPAPAS